jgi:capsular polysaccharide biosynthesis protein
MEYQEVIQQQREAELALEAEQDSTGRRFTLIEPPILPAYPVGPNRLAMVMIGGLLGFALGIVVVTLAELLDRSVRGEKAVAEIVGASPLVSVPYIQNEFDVKAMRRRRVAMIGGTVIAILIAISIIGFAQ